MDLGACMHVLFNCCISLYSITDVALIGGSSVEFHVIIHGSVSLKHCENASELKTELINYTVSKISAKS